MTTAIALASAPVATSTLADALDAIDRADSPQARVKAAADALHGFGFDRVLITLRDSALSPTLATSAGAASDGDGLQPLPGVVWRRRLPVLERFRDGDLYLLDGTDPWVAREFFGVDAAPLPGEPGTWLETDLIIGLIRGADNELLGIVKVAAPFNARRPDQNVRREIGWLVRHLGARLAYDTLRVVAQRQAERLQRLQEAGAALARSLDEREIIWELARQTVRATRADGVVIASPDLQNDTLVTELRLVRGAERPRGIMPLGDGVIAEVARMGRPVRLGEKLVDRARALSGTPMLSTYDVVGDAGPALSIVAVPLLMGIRLIGVVALHSASGDAFSPEDEEVVATMASQAATAIANARRYSESEKERRQTAALADVARAVSESLRPGDVLRLILRHSMALLGAEGACVALRQDDYMNIVAGTGSAEVLAGVHLPVETSVMGHVASIGERIVSNDYVSDNHANKVVNRLLPIRRAVIAPLTTARGTIGALAVVNRETPFTPEDGRILQRLADHVAVAIVNARLFEGIERATREWKLAFDAIATGIVVLDEQQRITRCNVRAAELCGSDGFQLLLGKHFGEALLGVDHYAEPNGLSTLIDQALEFGEVVRGSIRDERGNRLLDVSTSPHPDGGLVVTFDDVTLLHRLAEQHRRVVETASDAIVITGIDRRISMANPAAHTLFKRGANLIGCGVHELVAREAISDVVERETDAFSGREQRYECDVVRTDGERRRVAVSSAPLIEMGQVTGIVASLRDITEQRADAAAREQTEAQYERIVESATDSIFTVDTLGRFTAVNRALERATGRSRCQLLGMPCISTVDPRDLPLAHAVLQKTLKGERQQAELRYIDDSGNAVLCMLISSPIMSAGVVSGGLGIVRELSPRV
jgi:PAS domain S-box-containing protein